MTKLIIAIRKFAEAPKNCKNDIKGIKSIRISRKTNKISQAEKLL